jgi:hypothetical protein
MFFMTAQGSDCLDLPLLSANLELLDPLIFSAAIDFVGKVAAFLHLVAPNIRTKNGRNVAIACVRGISTNSLHFENISN